MVPYSSFYEILNVPDNAGIEEIKTAFRMLALKHHPDKNNNSPESEADFRLIYNAYSVLADPVKKEEYDAYLRTSSVLKSYKRPRSGASKAKAVLPGIAGSTYGSMEKVFSHINFLLWDIEDFMRKNNAAGWDREYGGKPLMDYILNILIFMDKWVLNPAGYPDYFLEARKMNNTGIAESIYNISFREGKSGHRPFVNMRDYFYNIRKRMDKFLNKAAVGDLVKIVPGCGIRLIDCIFEAENYAVHYMTCLNQALGGDGGKIPSFRHSNACFG